MLELHAETDDPAPGRPRPGAYPDRTALQRSLDELLAASDAQCASLSRFDVDAGQCFVEVTSGTTLVARGGLMPIECSTNFTIAAGGDVFESADLRAATRYDRGWDVVTVAAGMRSTCTIPLALGSRSLGAVSFSSREPGVAFAATIDSVMSVSDQLVLTLLGHERDGRGSRRVLICVDDLLAAEGLARIAERELGAEIIACATIEEVAARVRSETDLVLLDSYVQGRRVDEHADVLRRHGVKARVMVVSSYDVESNRAASLRAGAMGYVARHAPVPEIGDAIVRVGSGDRLPAAPVAAAEPRAEQLTAREGQILVLLERGLQVKQIARHLGISDATVKGYQRNLFTKLDVHSTTAAIYAARRSGLLQSLQSTVTAPSPDGILTPLVA
jgi:DNA-binding NarL/FixJ family response regulator